MHLLPMGCCVGCDKATGDDESDGLAKIWCKNNNYQSAVVDTGMRTDNTLPSIIMPQPITTVTTMVALFRNVTSACSAGISKAAKKIRNGMNRPDVCAMQVSLGQQTTKARSFPTNTNTGTNLPLNEGK
jgi:hypothetical protein